MLTKLNYYIHTDAIKNNLIPINLTIEQINYIYASEADLLNVALFGMKASEWKKLNPDKKDNIRDYVSIIELSILSNIEYHNAILIKDGFKQKERLLALNKSANEQKEIFNKNTKNEVKIIENEQTK